MGNDVKKNISDQIYEMKKAIKNFNYAKSKEIYDKIIYELNQIYKQGDINEIVNYLIESHTEKKVGEEFRILITNIKPIDKLCYLFQLIYENELIESIEKQKEDENSNSKIKRESTIDKNDVGKLKQKINDEMAKIIIVNNYLEFVRFKSIMYEKIAEKFYNLGSIMYTNYSAKKNQLSSELHEIVDIFTECVKNYKNTQNQKTKLEEYNMALEKVTAHYNILLGREFIKIEKFEDALNCFQKINFNNSEMLLEKRKGIHLCYEKMAEIEEEKKNYEQAIEYYTYIENDLKIYELNIKINEIYIKEYIKKKDFDKVFEHFQTIFELVNKAKNREFVELKFSKIFGLFIELMVELAVDSYQNKTIQKYIQTLEKLKENIENEGINSEVGELIFELNKLDKDDSNIYFDYIKNSINKDNSEIKQRFYLSLLIIKYLQEKPTETITLLLMKDIKLNYLTLESMEVLREYLRQKETLEDLLLISKLFYRIIVNFGIFQRIENLNVLGMKIQNIIKIPDIDKNNNFNDVIEYLISAFQEILLNNKEINNYNSMKKLICNLLLKFPQFIITISKSLLFLSTMKQTYGKNIIDIIISNLIQNENDNLLETLFTQCQLQPGIVPDYLDSIYKILFNYQKMNIRNKSEKIVKIFTFLLTLDQELISSNVSITNLEKYITEMEINPLCYALIEKIPIQKRSIKLSQQLSSFKEKNSQKYANIVKEDKKIELYFKSTITKDDLPELEKKIDDQFYVEKLVDYLKNQKYLLEYLNIEEISKHFSSTSKELFNLLIENEVHFTDEALINLLSGFYRNSEPEIKETFDIFNKIRQYQNKFPSVVEINLKIEDFLKTEKYKSYQTFDMKLKEIYNDFDLLKGFARQHQKFILYLLRLPGNEKNQEILNKMTTFLVKKNYNIGVQIYQKILSQMHSNEFINISESIFTTNKIPKEIKNLTKVFLYIILKGTNNKLNVIKSFKFFVDFIELSDNLLDYLLSLLQYEKEGEMYREIIFILGNYFSTNTKQEDKLDIILVIISERKLYQDIVNNITSIKDKREILYLFGCLNYYNYNINQINENEVLSFPVRLISHIVRELNNTIDKQMFNENLKYFNNHYHFGIFSPKRDKNLRKLFFNHKKNPINQLKLLCG